MSRINFDLKLIKGVVFDVDGVLSPSTIPMNDKGEPARMVNIKDGYAIQFAVKCGLKIAVISGATTKSLALRYNSLGVQDVYLKASKKLPVLLEWLEKEGLSLDEVAFCGDDIPDIRAMQAVALSVAPADAAVDVKAIATYITVARGGYGVARELLEEILKVRGQWMSDADAFGW
jgi:3-deoxy-D-manno-octulosonate 8-phosphate phosphatase (KDO 8-P phosphatase)